MVQLLAWLVAGGIIGLLASLVIKTDGLQDLLLNLGGGIAGAALGGWLVSRVRTAVRVSARTTPRWTMTTRAGLSSARAGRG